MTEARWQWNKAEHRDWLRQDAARQFAFFRAALDPRGGFHSLANDGRVIPDQPRELHATTRMVHSFGLGQAAGLVLDGAILDHGMDAIWRHHRDRKHGGYIWSFAPSGGAVKDQKLAYGHAFVLLAASTAHELGHPDAARLLADISQVIDDHFWDRNASRLREEFARDWSAISAYRGMNANMHSTEAFLAAHEATGERLYLDRALSLIRFFVGQMGVAHGWRLPEHYCADWQPDMAYEGDPMFRPIGSTPGHSFEWARLILQAWDLDGRRDGDLLDWARQLYRRARADGWGPDGVIYTVGFDGRPLRQNRYWWPVTEAIGAAAALLKAGEDLQGDYAGYWRCAEAHFIDEQHGGWFPEAERSGTQFAGKPDIYHAIQADLYPPVPVLSHQLRALRA